MVTTSTTDSENERLEIIKDSESENGSGKLNKMAASQVLFSSFIFQLTVINRVSSEYFLILDFPAGKIMKIISRVKGRNVFKYG